VSLPKASKRFTKSARKRSCDLLLFRVSRRAIKKRFERGNSRFVLAFEQVSQWLWEVSRALGLAHISPMTSPRRFSSSKLSQKKSDDVAIKSSAKRARKLFWCFRQIHQNTKPWSVTSPPTHTLSTSQQCFRSRNTKSHRNGTLAS
jgi:hypothetical protein